MIDSLRILILSIFLKKGTSILVLYNVLYCNDDLAKGNNFYRQTHIKMVLCEEHKEMKRMTEMSRTQKLKTTITMSI